MRKYNPITTTDNILVDILAELEKISKQICQAEPKEDLFEPLEKFEQLDKKICKTCGSTHSKPIEYAMCARRKKEV